MTLSVLQSHPPCPKDSGCSDFSSQCSSRVPGSQKVLIHKPQWGWHRHHDQHSKVRTELSLLAWCPCCTQVSAHSPGLPYPRSCRLSPARPTPGWFWMASTVCSLHFQGALLPAHAVLWKMIQLILQQIGFNLWCCSFSVKYTLVQGSSDRLCEGERIWKGKAGKVWRNEA